MNKLDFVEQELGTATIEEIFVDSIIIGTEIADALKDGVDIGDTFVVLKNAARIERAYKNGRQALREFKDLTPDEADRVVETVAQKFDIENDRVEELVERSLRLAARSYRYVLNGVDLFRDYEDLINDFKAKAA